MKQFVKPFTILIISMLVFASCKKASITQAKFVPKNADAVLVVDMASLRDKLIENKDNLEKIITNMEDRADTMADKMGNEWMALLGSGIDFNNKLVVFAGSNNTANKTDTTATNNIVTAVAVLKDEKKLENYLQKKFFGNTIQKEADYSYLAAEGDKIVGWNNEVVIIMYYQKPAIITMEYDSASKLFNLGQPANKAAELKKALAATFNLKQSETLANLVAFNDLLTEKADAYAWANASEAQQNLPLQLPKLNELLENTYTAATINFDEGKVVFKSRTYTSEPMRDILKKYAGPKVDLSLVEKFPSGNINAFMVFAFDPQIFNGIVRYAQSAGFVDGVVSKFMGTTFTLQDVLSAVKGDIGVVIADVGIANVDSTGAAFPLMMMPKAKVLFTLPLGDEARSQQIIDRLVANGSLQKVNGTYTIPGILGMMPTGLSITKKSVVLASDSAVLQGYLAGNGGATIAANVKEGLSDKAGVMYINLQSIFNGVPVAQKNKVIDSAMAMAKNTFKDVKATLGNYNGKYIEGQMELRMMDAKTNSFTTLVTLAANASQQSKGKPVITTY